MFTVSQKVEFEETKNHPTKESTRNLRRAKTRNKSVCLQTKFKKSVFLKISKA